MKKRTSSKIGFFFFRTAKKFAFFLYQEIIFSSLNYFLFLKRWPK